MFSLFRKSVFSQIRTIRSYSSGTLTPSELRFKKKLEEADRIRQKNAPEWEKRDTSLRKRYGGWNPTHKLSRQQMNDIRDLKARAPELKTVQIADFFNINPESIRRILKSKWEPGVAEQARQEKRAEVRKAESLQRKLAERELAKKGAILDTGVLKTGASEIGASETGALKPGALKTGALKIAPVPVPKTSHNNDSLRSASKPSAMDRNKKKFGSGSAYIKKNKFQKLAASSRPPARGPRKPFTQGVGDLLE